MIVKMLVKNAVVKPLSAAGVFSGSRSLFKCKVVVLCYHRVVESSLDNFQPGMAISKTLFERHMEWLAKRFDIVGFEEFAGLFLTGRRPERPSAIVTFDDGWLDNYEVAFPVLKRLGLTAVIFLPTRFIGSDTPFWNARAEMAIRRIHANLESVLGSFPDELMPPEAEFLMRVLVRPMPLSSLIDRIILEVKVMPPESINRITDFLDLLAGDGQTLKSRVVLNWDEVREMSQAGIRFGSHSASHPLMDGLSASECYQEATESMEAITAELGTRPISFAYPNGNYDEKVVREVRRAGYLCGCTITPGFANRTRDLFNIPRFTMHEGAAPNEAALDFLLSGFGGR